MEKLFNLTEKEYRNLKIDSYSSIKDFDVDPQKYKKKYIDELVISEGDEEKTFKDELRFGSLVDCLSNTPEEKDSLFLECSSTAPSGQYGDFINNMINVIAGGYLTKDGIAEDKWGEIYNKSWNKTVYNKKGDRVAYKGKEIDVVIDLLNKGEGHDYLTETLEVLIGKKIPIYMGEEDKALKLVNWVKNHPYTADIYKKRAVYNQYPLVDDKGKLFGIPIKGLLDKVEFNSKEKWIQPYDLKTTAFAKLFFHNFFKLRYYLQNTIYYKLLEHFFPGWEIRPMKFIVLDKNMYVDPFILETTIEHVNWGLEGFYYGGRKYKGLNTLIEEIKYCKNSGVWSSSVDIQKNKGVIKLGMFTDLNQEEI